MDSILKENNFYKMFGGMELITIFVLTKRYKDGFT
jgi:hypothetical protein